MRLRRRIAVLALLLILIAAAAIIFYYYNSNLFSTFISETPLSLLPGDSWSYFVIYPDSKGYTLTETVQGITSINGTSVYVILRQDNLHMTDEYMLISTDWLELKSSEPYVGNILANRTTTYEPPFQLFKIPFRVGDSWIVNGTVVTVTKIDGRTLNSSYPLRQFRKTVSLETASTPSGDFDTYRITVRSDDNSILEQLWFSTKLGNIVRGEYYNGPERVTQTLVDYSLTPRNTSVGNLSFSGSAQLASDENLSQAICIQTGHSRLRS